MLVDIYIIAREGLPYNARSKLRVPAPVSYRPPVLVYSLERVSIGVVTVLLSTHWKYQKLQTRRCEVTTKISQRKKKTNEQTKTGVR